MTAVTFDTLKALETLKAHNFTEEQAKGIIHALQSVDTTQIATKRDLNDLRSEIKSDLKELALNLTIKNGAMMFTLGGILIAVRFFAHW